MAKADLDNDEAVAYLQDVIERAGLNEALRRAGARPGDTVSVGDADFEFTGMMKSLVVKVGSSTVADESCDLRRRLLAGLVAELAGLVHGGARVVLVSSGAIACGQQVLGGAERPRQIAGAAGGLGRGAGPALRPLRAPRCRPGADRRPGPAHQRGLRAPRQLRERAQHPAPPAGSGACVPVVNENDTTATDEIRFGDNDVLAAQVAMLLRADLLLLLTDRDGLYTSDPDRDPEAQLVERVSRPGRPRRRRAPAAAGSRGAGGMEGKVAAALMAASAGVRTVIANGARPGVVTDALAGRPVGTDVVPQRRRGPGAFKLWLRYAKPRAWYP